MMQNNQRNAKTTSRRKAFLRIISITVTFLLAISMIIMPVSAATPESGAGPYGMNSEYTFYRATDAADATDSEGTATPYVSSDDSVWKFAVAGVGDTFKAVSADFAAPTAEPLKGGTSLKLTWSAPEGAEGKATVKVIADNYNKEVVVAGNTVTLNDVTLGNTYQVQVTVGEVSSQILSYSHIYAPTIVTNSSKNEKYEIKSNSTRKYDYMFVNVEDYADLITANSGILVKVTSEIKEDANVISYYDNHTGVKAQISCDTENAAMAPISMATGDVSIAFQAQFLLPVLDENGGYAAGNVATVNADATRKATCFDINGGKLIESSDTKNITSTSLMKQQGFTEGYIFIPFDMVDSTSIETIKENGSVNINLQSHCYYAKNLYENNNTWGWDGISWSEVDYKTDATGNINYWFDRTVSFDEVAFISDYDAFLDACLETTVHNEGKANQYKTGALSYEGLYASSTDNSKVYTSVVEGTTYTLKSDVKNSQYDYYDIQATYTVEGGAGFTYTTAAGEKMMLGFTVQQDGKYEISAPITTTVANGVTYRVVKEDADGNKALLQAEKTYAGEEHFTLMTADLVKGDTVYFEAWANTPGTVIDIGVPQFRLIGSKAIASDGTITYNSLHYLQDAAVSNRVKAINPAWQIGYFVNNFTVNDTEYDIALKSVVTAEGAVVKQDMLGLANLSATDDTATETNETDAVALYNALHPMDTVRANGTTYYYQSKYNRLKTTTSLKNPGNGEFIGTTNVADNYNFRTYVGFNTAFAGGEKNMYYNAGTYFQFTATADGIAAFSTGNVGDTAVNANAILLKNSTVIGTYVGGSGNSLNTLNTTVDVVKGDTITICFYDISGTVATHNCYISAPTVKLTPAENAESAVSFDSETPNIINGTYTNGTEITLPTTAKNGAIFTGWKADDEAGTVYNAGDKYAINADVKFEAQYIYYGDLDGNDGAYQGTDISILRKMIMRAAETGGDANAEKTGDIDANGKIDIIDLVKMKKMSVGIDTAIGAK